MTKLYFVLALAVLTVCACSADQPANPRTNAQTAVAPASTTVPPQVRHAIAATLAAIASGARVQTIGATPIAGLYQVVAQGQVLYMTGDGRYLIQGDAFDTATHTPLNSATMNRLRRDAIAGLKPGQMIRFAPANPKYTVTVFTDVDCPYCKAFHANMAAMNKLGIAVDYLFWPRSGLGTASAHKAANVWCAADRKAALTAAFLGKESPRADCHTPVAHDFHLGVDLGVEGTPAVFAANGTLLGGYVDPQELLRRLEATQASR